MIASMRNGADCVPSGYRRRIFAVAVGAVFLAAAPMVRAQSENFPSKPVRLITWSLPGGPIDNLARLFAQALSRRFRQAVIVEGKPGASGIIASQYVASASADGHTLLVTLPTTHINNVVLHAKLPYDPVRDFEPVSQVALGSIVLAAAVGAPFSNVAEFVTWTRDKPGGATYGSWGTGSTGHAVGELLRRQTDAPLVHVPYKGDTASMTDLLAGSIDATFVNTSTARPLIQAGRVKALGITGPKRVSALPGVTTFAEQGYKSFELSGWVGVFAPARTPRAVVEKISTALREISKLPEVQARLIENGFEPLGTTPEQFAENYRAEFPRWSEIIRASGVQAQ